jgi:DNA-binding ferritin-like protein
VRLHALLDEQFSEIGIRLTRLAARSRDLGAWHSTGSGERAAAAGERMASGALQAYIIRQLLDRHETLLTSLRRGTALVAGSVYGDKTFALLADLTAEHEKDAFMLRALLWEVQKTAA